MHSDRFVLVRRCIISGIAIAALTAACTRAPEGRGAVADFLVDDFSDTVRLDAPAVRIASLNPATTELIFALGAGDRLVGRSRWDAYPPEAARVPDLGDGMRPNVEAILAARPDLVLLYASPENRGARDALRRAGVQTLTQRIDRTDEFAAALMQLGRVIGDTVTARIVRDSVLASYARARSLTESVARVRVVWPLWDAPLLVVGSGSFLDELLGAAGATNIFADLADPSPRVTFEELVRRDPDVVLVGPDRGRAIMGDPQWRALRAVRTGRVLAYDTLLVGRPGVRLGEAALHLARLLHPEIDQ